MRKAGSIALLIGLVLSVSVPASAAIILYTGNIPQADENVLLTSALPGNPLFGETNISHLLVRFESTTDILEMPSGGQARVEATDAFLNNLTISIPGARFTSLIWDAHGLGGYEWSVTSNGGVTIFGGNLGNGSNFFTLVADGGEQMESVTLSSVGGLEDVRQVRIGGAALIQVVPEPATDVLLGLGLLTIAWVRRRFAQAR